MSNKPLTVAQSKAVLLNAETEAELQAKVLELAKRRGWRCAHFRPARVTINGKETWRTPVQGDAGFFDLVLARKGTVILVELKREDGEQTRQQFDWDYEARPFTHHVPTPSHHVYLWRPSDWPEIERVLA